MKDERGGCPTIAENAYEKCGRVAGTSMHRVGGEDDDLLLAISPPPEFQDLPAPPPTVFRDLSPSPSALLGVGGNKSRTHHPHYYHHLSEFAARISFDILNEAMVIATEEVLSHGGCTVRCGSSSSSANPIISTTHHNVVHTSGSPRFEQNLSYLSFSSLRN